MELNKNHRPKTPLKINDNLSQKIIGESEKRIKRNNKSSLSQT